VIRGSGERPLLGQLPSARRHHASSSPLRAPQFPRAHQHRPPARAAIVQTELWRSCVYGCVTIVRRLLGAVLVVVGAVWIGQGTRIIQGSSMTGSTFWTIIGALCVIGGLGLLSWPWRQSPADP
jgi:hypothetical protein